MKIKSIVAGLIISMSMFAIAGTSQACGVVTCPVQKGFTGIGWHMVPCSANIPPARTWQQYVSGGYAPPVTTSQPGFLFW